MMNSLMKDFLTVGGIAGVIAVMIAGAIAGRYFAHGPEEIPQILTYSMTTIIGFYFGSATTKHSGQPTGKNPK